jgi:alginate O-acetyltransferase complex protein AlgI
MLFNSFEFVVFLPTVFFLYWFWANKKLVTQNLFLLVVSYLFYGWWDWRFLFLIIASSLVDFTLGKALDNAQDHRKRKQLLYLSLTLNLGFLGFFKYFNFFISSFADLMQSLHLQANITTLQIVLPVGISFYTFQSLSYTVDIYKREIKATQDPITFLAFVSFFPQLVAGPIERAKHLLPQFEKRSEFDYEKARDGMRQMLWGFFKKIVIADQCALHANYIFDNYEGLPPSMLLLGAIYFSFQIYGDFSGYSDIAIGTARLFGFDLMQNFNFPYLSRNVAEFWRRWHISLSTWFKDYVYIPLGGSRIGQWGQIRNNLITFTISGLWHGANWTFIFWGFLNGLYYIPLILTNRHNKYKDIIASNRFLPKISEMFGLVLTFILTVITWIFFRSATLTDAFRYIGRMIDWQVFQKSPTRNLVLPYIAVLFIVEYFSRKKKHPFENFQNSVPRVVRWVLYAITFLFIFKSYTVGKSFIYFQF